MKQNTLMKKIFTKISFVDTVNLICLSVILGIIPLIVRINGRAPTDEELLIRTSSDIWESFSYYKSFWIIVVGCIVLFTAISSVAVGEAKPDFKRLKEPVIAAVGVYIIFALLSTILSEYKITALKGIAERHESVFILIMYMVILLTAKSFVKNETFARILFYVFIVSALFIGLIGAMQTFGYDIFKTEFGKKIVLGEYYKIHDFEVGYTKTYATLYNPNCVGLYAAFLTPVFFFTGLFTDKKNPLKYICFFICLLMFACLYGSDSVAGYIGFFTATAVSLIVIGVYTYKFGKRRLLFFGCVAAVALSCIVVTVIKFDYIKSFIVYNFNLDGSKYGHFIRDLSVWDNYAKITTERGSFLLKATDGSFEILYPEKNEIAPENVLQEEGYERYVYTLGEIGRVELIPLEYACYVSVGGVMFAFGQMENGEITALSPPPSFAAIDVNEKIPSVGFKNLQHMATGRGFIWSHSIPLLTDNLIIGGGPDSFAYQFPQRDIVGKIRGLGLPYTIVDKPHNTYLQIGINTGVISLLAILFIFGYYIYTSCKAILTKRYESKFLFGLSVGFLTGICAYLVCSLSTDSTVSVSPIFYAGLGFALALTEIINGTKSKG